MINFSFIIKYLLTALWVILLQISILDNLQLSDLTYIPAYLILMIALPKTVRVIPLMIISFLTGMLLDYLSGSAGSITATLVLISVLRSIIIRKIIPYEVLNRTQSITVKRVGIRAYLGYTLLLVLIFNSALFMLESLMFLPTIKLISKIALSTAVTIPVIIALNYMMFDNFD